MSVKELRAAAKAAGIKGFSRMTKPELEAALGQNVVAPLFSEPLASPPNANRITDDDVQLVFATMTKGEARKLRKELRSQGRIRQAGLPALKAA